MTDKDFKSRINIALLFEEHVIYAILACCIDMIGGNFHATPK